MENYHTAVSLIALEKVLLMKDFSAFGLDYLLSISESPLTP